MRLFALMIRGRLLDEVERRIAGLSEPQLDSWLKGHVSLMDAVLQRYGESILEHREIALSVLDVLSMQDVQERLVRARPELADRWRSVEFERAFAREARRLRDFLGPSPELGPEGAQGAPAERGS
jgi:hypothetical protein